MPSLTTTTSSPAEGGGGAARRTGRHGRSRRRAGRRRWLRRALTVTVVLVALAVAAGVGAYVYVGYRFDQITKVHAPHLVHQVAAAPGAPFNVLLVGSDSRSFVSNAQQEQAFGNPSVQGGQRSDVTIVARFVPATHQVYLLSIPRDLWVDIPGHGSISGMNRINAAFDSGPDLLVQTIEQDLHIPINHYMAVNFQGFQQMVDALGGITMDFPDPLRDSYSGLDVTTTGCQLVGGATALELVRARHLSYRTADGWQYDGLSDFSRIQRQDAFFRAVLDKLHTVAFNPFTVNSFIGAAVHNLTIDDTITKGDLVRWAEEFHGISSDALHTMTLPTVGHVTSGGADVLLEAQPYADDMILGFDLIGKPTTTTTTTSTTTTVPAVAPSSVTVQVVNGAEVAGIAHRTAAALATLGFVDGGTGNAPSPVTVTQVEYGPGQKAAAQLVASHLGGPHTLVLQDGLAPHHVTVVLGTRFTAVSGAGLPSTGTTTTTTTLPAAPPSDVYTNTQPEPWNPTPCTL